MNETNEYEDCIIMDPIILRGEYETRTIWLNDKELNPEFSQKIYNHSAAGFDWGHTGDGCAQLSLAILLELTQNKRISMILHHIFKNECISALPRTDFELKIDIGEWLNKHTSKNYMFPNGK